MGWMFIFPKYSKFHVWKNKQTSKKNKQIRQIYGSGFTHVLIYENLFSLCKANIEPISLPLKHATREQFFYVPPNLQRKKTGPGHPHMSIDIICLSIDHNFDPLFDANLTPNNPFRLQFFVCFLFVCLFVFLNWNVNFQIFSALRFYTFCKLSAENGKCSLKVDLI